MLVLHKLLNFAKDIATNYDHDEDAHRYDTRCRECEALQVIREVMGDKADSFLNGPYFGTSEEVVESLRKLGSPVDHLSWPEPNSDAKEVDHE